MKPWNRHHVTCHYNKITVTDNHLHWSVSFNKFATLHDLNLHMSILRHQYLFQMLGRCIYDIWERFCVAKINIVHFTSKNSSTRFSFFCYSLLYTILAGDKSRAGFVRRTFNPKSTGVLSMQKCIEWVVPRRGNEIHFLSTFPYNAIRPKTSLAYRVHLHDVIDHCPWIY